MENYDRRLQAIATMYSRGRVIEAYDRKLQAIAAA